MSNREDNIEATLYLLLSLLCWLELHLLHHTESLLVQVAVKSLCHLCINHLSLCADDAGNGYLAIDGLAFDGIAEGLLDKLVQLLVATLILRGSNLLLVLVLWHTVRVREPKVEELCIGLLNEQECCHYKKQMSFHIYNRFRSEVFRRL